jgi:hypothetical protein
MKTAMAPCDQLVEGFPDFVLPNGAMALAMNILLYEISAEAGGVYLSAVRGELRDGNDRVVDRVERQHGAA